MSHGNARTTVHGRKLIVERWQHGWKKAHIAAAMGISRQCVRTWIGRYQTEGEPGLADRSSRPRTSPRRTAVEVEERIVELRRRERRGPAWIGAELGVPARTVSRVLVRRGLPRLAALDPMTGQLIRATKHTAVRYERSRPGELVHMDVKKLARIPDGGGWRAHGRAAGSTSRRRDTVVGYDYVHSLVDDHSRLAYSEIHSDEQGTTCAAFLDRAAAYFAGHGIDRIEPSVEDHRTGLPRCLSHRLHGVTHLVGPVAQPLERGMWRLRSDPPTSLVLRRQPCVSLPRSAGGGSSVCGFPAMVWWSRGRTGQRGLEEVHGRSTSALPGPSRGPGC